MKNLAGIVWKIPVVSVIGDLNIPILSISFDSRKVEPGTLFVAIHGTVTDGHHFVADVVRRGASAIVCEEMPASIRHDITYIITKDTSLALGLICNEFYDRPSKKLKLIGVTGTNGKTTTVTLLYHLFRKMGYKAGLISTVACYIDGQRSEATHTTPDSLKTNALMAQMVQQGCEYCFMEVSSHAVVQQRIAGLTFAGGVFTNLTHDHLDFHKTFAEYLKAKKTFFDNLPDTAFALVNKDDRNGTVMVQNTKAAVKTCAMKSMADFRCRVVEHDFAGMLLQLDGREAWMRLIGEFNACNLLAVYAVAVLLGQKPEETLTAMSTLTPVDGRFEFIRSAGNVTAVVDYAHTPDALENVLKAIHGIFTEKSSHIITVVGCGGDRDKTKRPEMAKIAVASSSRVIFTSDNPRSEEPDAIINDMLAGLDNTQRRNTIVIADRREAIRTACIMAASGDVVLVAGKGHETYQIVKGVKSHFDDREVVKEAFLIEN
jgi:UDP-N-acetylmuramoyl-L-alanyl-D-glutamate--2,6-diaminopimelate ligase